MLTNTAIVRFSEICKSVIEIFWDEVFMVRNTMKSEQHFLATISVACSRRSDCGDSAKRCEQGKKRGGRGEVPSSVPLSLFLLILFLFYFFARSLPSRRTPLSERLEQATIFVGPLQLHLHKRKCFFLTGFDPD